jgi:hypothetical protein
MAIVIEAQDRASEQLRRLGQEVQRLEQRVQSTSRGGGLLGGLNLGAGLRAFDAAVGGIGDVFRFVKESVVDLNAALETTQASYEGITRNAGAARELLAVVSEEAGRGFDLTQLQAAGRQLLTFSEGSIDRFRELLQVVEQLNAADPGQGLESAGFAIREALSGDFQSLIERFEVSRQSIARWRQEGLSNLEIVQRAVESVGGSAEAVERLGRTFESRQTSLQSFGNELRRLVGAGLFSRLNDLFGRLVALVDEYGDRLRQLATEIGAAIGAFAERAAALAAGPLRALTEAFAPGLWDQMATTMARMPETLEQTASAAQRAAVSGESLERTLGRLGVDAATLQLQADRVRRSYDEQLEPLERQLRLLQQSGDLQRIQNALASNRGAVERIRLERELVALQGAAGGREDPNAEGLTLRQRLIALALQERRLRLEELGLTEQQRPAVQSLQERIAAVQEEQRQVLKPLQDQLALYRDQATEIQLRIQQEQQLRQEIEETVARQKKAWESQNGADTLEAARKRGEELAEAWSEGFKRWLDAGGGSVWGAIGKSLEQWYATAGKPLADRIGADLGAALADALSGEFARRWEQFLKERTGIAGLEATLARLRGEATGAGSGGGGSGFGGPPMPLVSPTALAGARGEGGATVVNIGTVEVTSGGDPQQIARAAGDAVAARVLDELTRSAGATDPGASRTLQGAGR